MPKISVIMPVYNVEKYLRECLDSVLAQTMRDFEVICVGDSSTDGSAAILDEYAEKIFNGPLLQPSLDVALDSIASGENTSVNGEALELRRQESMCWLRDALDRLGCEK